MSRFRTSKTLFRESAGSYVNGKWVAGARSVLTTLASIQPIVMGQDMQSLAEGRHMSDYIKFYTADELVTTSDGSGLQPDIIIFGEYGYEIVSYYAHQSNIRSHYKYIAVKALNFTSNADWLSGTTTRALNV